MVNVLEYLEKAVREYPERIAYQSESENASCAQIMERAKRIGSALCPLLPPGSPVIVMSEKSVLTPVMYHAILYAGCFYIPLSTDLPVFRLKTIMEIVESTVILTDGKSGDLLDSLGFSGTIVNANDLEGFPIDEDTLSRRRAGVLDIDPIYVIFTSGTSGNPKGVVTSHRAVIDYINVFAKTFSITSDDILGSQAPFDYIAAIRDIYLPLFTGAKTVLIPKSLFSMPAKLFEYVNENKITTICWVAAALALCSELKAFDAVPLTTVVKVIFTGSAMPCKHLRAWQEHLPDALYANHYGPTEITASCTYYIVPGKVEPEHVLPIGIPFENTGILILSEDGAAVSDGEVGEICVRGSGLALGYYKDPVRTAEAFIKNPLQPVFEERIYKTGDLGKWLTDGNLSFHGRRDFQIKHMGHRIELSEIEISAGSLSGLQSCCCLYLQEKEQIWLFFTGEIDSRELSIFLRERLPSYMIPRKFKKLDEMPVNFNGKLDVEALKRMMA